SLSHNHFFSRFDGHGNQFNVVGRLAFLRRWITLANRRHQAWIINAEHLDDRVARAQLLHTISQAVAPGLLIPGNFQRGITVSILGNVGLGLHAGYGLDQPADAIDAAIPFGIKLFLVQFEPGLERGQATDDFFFPNLHGAAHCAFSWSGIQQGSFDQVLSPKEDTAALRPAQALASRKAVQVNSHLGVELGVVDRRYAGSIIQYNSHLPV